MISYNQLELLSQFKIASIESKFAFMLSCCRVVCRLSERVVDVLEVESAFSITEASKSSIIGHIEREAVSCNFVEFLDDFASFRLEALCADHVIAAPSQNQVLSWDEFD